MDLSDPTRAITPTLDGPVLAALASAGRPLTVSDVAAVAVRGSEIGVRRSLARLVEQGVVRATLVGRNSVYELNRDHIAADVAVLLSDLRRELWRRIRLEVSAWETQPLYACVFGSAARGDGDTSSDIDVVLVHPPLIGEVPLPVSPPSLLGALAEGVATYAALKSDPPVVPEQWHGQVDGLRDRVQAWTGNPLQVVDLSFREWWLPSESRSRFKREVERDRIEIVSTPPLTRSRTRGGSRA